MFKIIESSVGKCESTAINGAGVYAEKPNGHRVFLSWEALRLQVDLETARRNGMDAQAMERSHEHVA